MNSAQGVYVVQSGNISRRLAENVRLGKCTPEEVANAARQGVDGNKIAREIAEQTMIDRMGGIRGLRNDVNPIEPQNVGVSCPSNLQ